MIDSKRYLEMARRFGIEAPPPNEVELDLYIRFTEAKSFSDFAKIFVCNYEFDRGKIKVAFSPAKSYRREKAGFPLMAKLLEMKETTVEELFRVLGFELPSEEEVSMHKLFDIAKIDINKAIELVLKYEGKILNSMEAQSLLDSLENKADKVLFISCLEEKDRIFKVDPNTGSTTDTYIAIVESDYDLFYRGKNGSKVPKARRVITSRDLPAMRF